MARGRNSALIDAFASVLRDARLAAGLNQEELAFRAGVDRTFVGLLENSKRQATISVVFALAEGVGLSPETLVARTRKTLASKDVGSA
jgi:transcriptional regulator with XRE-family HTH domain